jgi:hypothetical protein
MMGWEQRRGRLYYYRSTREDGRVRKQYLGSGPSATMFANLDALDREERAEKWAEEQAEQRRYFELEQQTARVCALTEALARAVLLASGYRRHHRGEWRKRRGQDSG